MTKDEVRTLLDQYEQRLSDAKMAPADWPHGLPLTPADEARALTHVQSMIPKMREFLQSPEPKHWDKVMRWLGFLQGVLWTFGWYTLEELKSHNRGPQQP